MKCRYFSFAILLAVHLFAQSSDYPVFVAQVPNPNDYALFANSGGDGNWYVGYSNAWAKKLPPIPKRNYARAYLGAKLGRMKTLPPVGRPPQYSPVPGEFWMALSSTPSWTAAQGVKLTTSEDIPLDGDPQYAVENVGESQWFWTEIPLQAVNFSGENYVVLWTPTPSLVSVSSSPILAAAWGGKEINSWLIRGIKGEPPKDPKIALKDTIMYFQPAIALKLIPAGDPKPLQVHRMSWQNGTPDHPKPVITASVEGDSVERVWIEQDVPHRAGDVIRGQWTQVGRSLWKAPYIFSLDQEKLPHGKLLLRVAAVNIWEERAYSDPFEIEVSPIHAKK